MDQDLAAATTTAEQERRAARARDAGRLLREARLARGRTVPSIAEWLNIRPAYIDALERGDFAAIPDRPEVMDALAIYGEYLGFGRPEGATAATPAEAGTAVAAPPVPSAAATSRRLRSAMVVVIPLTLLAGAYAGHMLGERLGSRAEVAPARALTPEAEADPSAAAEAPAPPAPVAAERDDHGPEASPPLPPALEAGEQPSPAPAPAPVVDSAGAAAAASTAEPPPSEAPPVPVEPDAGGLAPGGPAPGGRTDTASSETAQLQASPATAAPVVAARFAIQVAAVRDLVNVSGEWEHLQMLFPSLDELPLQPALRVDVPGKGIFFRVVGGAFAARAEAQAACDRLRGEGGGCVVTPLP